MDMWGKRIAERGNRNEKALTWCEFQDSKSPAGVSAVKEHS